MFYDMLVIDVVEKCYSIQLSVNSVLNIIKNFLDVFLFFFPVSTF